MGKGLRKSWKVDTREAKEQWPGDRLLKATRGTTLRDSIVILLATNLELA
jgi:hypothetical protein